ncbi:MAG: helix-turn-helix domain-containing protein [Methylobacteriaceae bacterium]|nr:helix-turn-helix domain-containing protein [Methylobacteriaceae bacterium]MBV9634006.1 helix-turn-helix domain-containing protein [Methylobacteriaceae bacterium]MBV9704958.1 helix-turn-helix domain-containing protein [Methylobacteriaceae bacterium]
MTDVLIPEADNRDYVNSLARGLEVIRAFSRSRPRMTLSEVAQETDLTRAAARRFLLTLVREGYAESNGRHFRLSPKVLELGYSVLASMNIADVVQPVMNELADKLDESCFAAVLDGDSVVYMARASSRRVVNVGISVGSRVPAHCVSSGRVLLSGLSDEALASYLDSVTIEKFTPNTVTSKVKLKSAIETARRQGWAIVDQELEVGLRSISAPIRDRSRTIVAALNVCCPSPRVTPAQMRTRILSELLTSAQRISRAMPD